MIESIGQYEIERELGRGGMGVVYLGRDTRLDRPVAIKALPEALAADPDRLARFEREAKTLAQLSHPNIAGIHGVEVHEGARYLVLEYVEGETLADRLDRGPLPADEAIEIAAQVAAGVEAAHDAGVVHRDLKPGNVIVTPDGRAKVLDFGLARSDETHSSGSSVSQAPTLTSPAMHSPTIPGVILGTAAYMSPEQARGRKVDKRTDVWSFGVMLYEMLTGGSPFVGETVSDSIGAVLHKDIDLDRLPAGTPGNVRRVITRCVQRDRNERYRDIGDARLDLLRRDDDLFRGSTPGRSLPLWALPVVGLVTIAAAAAVWFAKPVPESAPLPVVQADIALPEGLQLAHSFMPGIAMSADERTLAFAAGSSDADADGRIIEPSVYFRGALYIRRLDEPDAVPVAGADDAWQPAFSPDGSSIAYVKRGGGFSGRFNGLIETIAVTGGRPTPLTTDVPGVAGIDWTDDGRILFGSNAGLRSIPEGGGTVTELTAVRDDGSESHHAFPDALPDGRGVLYTVVLADRQPTRTAIRVLDLASGQSRELLSNASNARYTRGHLVFARDHTIHAVPFDLETMALRGEPRPLGMSVIQSIEATNSGFVTSAAQFALSDAGDLAYAQGTIWPEIPSAVAWVTRDGDEEVIELDPGSFAAPRVDAAGRRLLLPNFYEPRSMIWMHDLARGVTSRLRRDSGSWVAWGPGPDEYTFHERIDGVQRVRWATIGDTAEPFVLDGPPGTVTLTAAGWSPDGRHLLCIAGEVGQPLDLFAWSEGDGWVNLTNTPDTWELWPSLSPDGRWVAYVSEGRVQVRPFLRAGPVIQVSTTRSDDPLWSPDGRELYYIAEVKAPTDSSETQTWVMAAPVTDDGTGIDIGRPERLFRADAYASLIPLRSWDMGPDGRFLMSRRASDESIRAALDAFFPGRIRLIQNWASTLEERTP